MFGQSIKGRIVDSLNTPLSFATIALLNKTDSSIYKGTITDDKGFYFFEKINEGLYVLKISAIGFKDKFSEEINFRNSENLTAPDISINPAGVSLNEVSVTTIKKSIEFKNGNITFNVANSVLVTGNNVFDLLKKTPTVMIDNNVISIAGGEGVKIYIDGRQVQLAGDQLINLLKAINANSVDKIEVMKNPPVQYDANGTAGVINIKLKKSSIVGFNGNVNGNTSQGFYNRADVSLSLNYKAKRFAFFSTLNADSSIYLEEQTLNRNVTNKNDFNNFNQHKFTRNSGASLVYKTGMDFYLSKKTTLGWQIDGENGKFNGAGQSKNYITGNNSLGFDMLQSNHRTPEMEKYTNYNINLENRLDSSGSFVSFSSDYTRTNNSEKSNYENNFYDASGLGTLLPNNYRNDARFVFNIYSAKVDFKKNLKNDFSVEAGAKGSYMASNKYFNFERLNNSTQQYIKDTTFSSDFLYSENIYAGYLNFSKQFEYLNVNIGSRVEQSYIYGKNKTSGFVFKPMYFNVYPNVSLEYQKSEKNNFQFNYNRRIERPTYEDLSPFRYFFDQFSSFIGNPYLSPQYNNNFTFSHTYKQVFTNSFSYTYINNRIMNITFQNDSTKEFVATNVNLNYSNRYAFTSFLQLSPTSWYNFNTTLNLFYNQYVGKLDGYDLNNTRLTLYGIINNVFILPKNFRTEVNFFYRGPMATGNLTVRAKYGFDIGINKKMCKGKLIIAIGIDDMFYTNVGATYTTFGNLDWKFKVLEDTRRGKLSVTYNFGKTKIMERDVISNEQEKERLGK